MDNNVQKGSIRPKSDNNIPTFEKNEKGSGPGKNVYAIFSLIDTIDNDDWAGAPAQGTAC